MIKYAIYETEWGWVGIAGYRTSVLTVILPLASPDKVDKQLRVNTGPGLERDQDLFLNLGHKLQDYFAGQKVEEWEINVDFSGYPAFTRLVLQYVTGIAYGQTLTYGGVAAALGNIKAARAVGQALKRNRCPVLVPCHRVIASTGAGGFTAPGGVDTKKALLQLEACQHTQTLCTRLRTLDKLSPPSS